MKKRELGKSGLKIAPFALGCNVFGWTVDEQTAFSILDAFTAAGCNCIDTADVYSRWVTGNKGGESETDHRQMAEAEREPEQSGARNQGREVPWGTAKKDFPRRISSQECEDSLERLQTDHIDLYQSHYDDQDTPLEETLEAYAQLVKAGKGGGDRGVQLFPGADAANHQDQRRTRLARVSEPADAV